jgi:hypothetical protein
LIARAGGARLGCACAGGPDQFGSAARSSSSSSASFAATNSCGVTLRSSGLASSMMKSTTFSSKIGAR